MSMAQDLFADMGRKVEEMRANGDRTEGVDDDEEADSRVVDEIESLCMNCHEDVSCTFHKTLDATDILCAKGITKLLLTRIPFFREIVIMSFYCDHCHFKNSEIQSAGEIQQRGSKYTLKLDSDADFERQVVKSDGCLFRVEDIDLEIPPGRGQYSNVEGILRMVLSDLESHQEDRRKQMPEVAAQLDVVLEKLRN
ncbi:nucleolar zinc-finger protein, partial [Cryomyces antarcticus]